MRPFLERLIALTGGWKRRSLLVLLALSLIPCSWAAWTWLTWPDVSVLKTERPSTTAFIERYREARRAEGRDAAVRWVWVPWDSISPYLKKAILAGEDTEFYAHQGFSAHETRQAIRDAVAGRRSLRGASTITQQLAKNLWLSPTRSLTRKLREALLTVQLERELGKRRILEVYLNVVEFGPGVFGAEAAARRFLGKPASLLTPLEAAMLAAALPRPSVWHPGSQRPGYQRRVEHLLELMAKLDYLDKYVGLDAESPASGP